MYLDNYLILRSGRCGLQVVSRYCRDWHVIFAWIATSCLVWCAVTIRGCQRHTLITCNGRVLIRQTQIILPCSCLAKCTGWCTFILSSRDTLWIMHSSIYLVAVIHNQYIRSYNVYGRVILFMLTLTQDGRNNTYVVHGAQCKQLTMLKMQTPSNHLWAIVWQISW